MVELSNTIKDQEFVNYCNQQHQNTNKLLQAFIAKPLEKKNVAKIEEVWHSLNFQYEVYETPKPVPLPVVEAAQPVDEGAFLEKVNCDREE